MKSRKMIAIMLVILMVLLCSCTKGTDTNQGSAGQETVQETTQETVYEFILTCQDPATSHTAHFINDWAAKVTEDSGGRIQFVMYYGGSLGSISEVVDMVLNGNADICWTGSGMGANSGRFPYTDVIALPIPGVELDSIQMGKIMWHLYSTFPEIKAEWSDFYVIECSANASIPFPTSKKQINSPSDFNGLRMRATVAPMVSYITALGAVPMGILLPDTFENLEKNVIDGCMNDWTVLLSFGLWDVLDYVMDYPIATTNQVMIMNIDKYNSLPDDLKAVMDANSGEYASIMAATYFGEAADQGKEQALVENITIYTPTPEVKAAMDAAAEVAIQEWIEVMNSKGLDGEKVIAAFNEAIELYS